MENQKIINALRFYLLATSLKDKIRSGWKIWHVSKERLESVAEHIYGTCILAISIESEFELNLNLDKCISMLVLHELEEIVIGDLTPFDKITKEEKRAKGQEAVKKVLASLAKKDDYFNLLQEFEEEKTLESRFARMCDKLECDIQVKLYCERNEVDLFADSNKYLSEIPEIKSRIFLEKSRNLADLFIENDRVYFKNEEIEKVVDFVKNNSLLELI